MVAPLARINIEDSMEVVMKKFDDTKAWNLPVVDSDGKYIGFLSKSRILNSYRQMLVDFSEE
jgi:CIC family chloride channel protein